MRRSVASWASAVVAIWMFGIMSAPSASALAPERQPVSFVGGGAIDCGTFEDNFIDFFDGFETVYFDSAGNPIRDVLNVEHHSNDSNSVTGLVLHEHGHFTVVFDLLSGTATVTGNQEIMNRPGTGVVVQDVGRVVFDASGNIVFFAGGRDHSELFLGDQVLCQALA